MVSYRSLEDTRERFRNYLDVMELDLCGSILDLACGPISLACLYREVYGHDIKPEFIESLQKNGIPARLADILDLGDYAPDSFDFVVSFNPPMKPFGRNGDVCGTVKRFLYELLSITREKVVIRSIPMMSFLPLAYDHLIECRGQDYVIYNKNNGSVFPISDKYQSMPSQPTGLSMAMDVVSI